MAERTYIAIDLKSFYASVECRERRLDPLDTHLVVADETRTDKTICLAVTPSLKSYGISGRGRLFEVRQRVKQVNAERQRRASGHTFTGASYSAAELRENPSLAMDFIIAPPHMAHYMAYSSRIYAIYMKYVAPEDMVVYSIDEVFMDVTGYLQTYGLTARELARKIILDVLNTTGITATAGIGTNLFLCKVAMDIVAKHVPADRDGVRIAELDERRFRHELWSYQPLTDFWRVGRGTAKNSSSTACAPWAISRCARRKTRICCISCSVKMRSCSSTMRGDGSRARSRISKPTSRAPTASAPGRCSRVRIQRTRHVWLSAKWRISWYSIW